jgi:hypothetical protein
MIFHGAGPIEAGARRWPASSPGMVDNATGDANSGMMAGRVSGTVVSV